MRRDGMLPADPEDAALEESSLMRILIINHRSEELQRFRQMLEAATDVRFEIAQALRVE
jgi:hypothetical protein